MDPHLANYSEMRGTLIFIRCDYFAVERFLGDLVFNVFSSKAAEGGGGTTLSKTMAEAVTSLP